MGAGGERCVFAASHRADLPLLLARPGLALLGNDPFAVLRAGRGHAEPLAVLDRDLLAPDKVSDGGGFADEVRRVAPGRGLHRRRGENADDKRSYSGRRRRV